MERLQTNEVALEQAQPDLLQVLGHEEVTVFGITGTLQDLARKCPVDLSDPRITRDMKNDFVVKAVNESGVAVSSEYEELFTTTLERFGLERKFTVKPPVVEHKAAQPEHAHKVPKRDSPTHPAAPKAPIAPIAKGTETPKPPASEPPKSALQASSHHESKAAPEPRPTASIIETLSDIALSVRQASVDAARPAKATESPRPPISQPESTVTHAAGRHGATILTAVQTGRELSQPKPAPAHDESEDASAQITSDEQSYPTTSEALWNEDAAVVINPVETTGANDPEVFTPELYKSPQEVYEDFRTALDEVALTLLAEQIMAPEVDPESTGAEQPATKQPNTVLLALLGEVTTSLHELGADGRQSAGEAIREVVGALHGLRVLESFDQTNAQAIEAAQASLAQACARLFELLGIEASESSVEQFVHTMMLPLFAAQFEAFEPLDERLDGMHERLRSLATASYWWPVISHQLLGRIVLTQPATA